MLVLRLVWIAAASLLLAPFPAIASPAEEHFEARQFESESGATLPYRLMKPAHYDASRKYPLVLFLHGAGERGTDNVAQLRHGMNDFAAPENRAKYEWFVLAPQCPEGKRWVEVDWTLDSQTQPEELSEPLTLTLELLEALQREFRIDADRLYVTGLSMGGYGAWDLIQRFPEKFAAAAPVCGGGDEAQAGRLANVAIWAFHGDQDTVVKPARSRNMIAAVERAGGKPRYTEYEGVAHNSWVNAYSDPELQAWLYRQKRSRK